MRVLICDCCGKEEEINSSQFSTIQRIFSSDLCYDCYEKIRDKYFIGGE